MDADHPYRLAVAAGPDAPTIVELPVHWALDDWEAYAYLPAVTGSGVIARPTEMLERWTLELDALVDEGGLFMLTNHPFLSGRASRAAALEGLVEHARSIHGLWIATCGEIAGWVEGLDLAPVFHAPPGGRRSCAGRMSEPARAIDGPGQARVTGQAERRIAVGDEPVDEEGHAATDVVGEVGAVEVVRGHVVERAAHQ